MKASQLKKISDENKVKDEQDSFHVMKRRFQEVIQRAVDDKTFQFPMRYELTTEELSNKSISLVNLVEIVSELDDDNYKIFLYVPEDCCRYHGRNKCQIVECFKNAVMIGYITIKE